MHDAPINGAYCWKAPTNQHLVKIWQNKTHLSYIASFASFMASLKNCPRKKARAAAGSSALLLLVIHRFWG